MTTGYLWATDAVPVAGERVRAAGPPWIVVWAKVAMMPVSAWPGRLLSVNIIRPAAAKDQPRAGAQYVLATDVEVSGEVPVAPVFGRRGDAVVEVLRVAHRLTEDDAAVLAGAQSPDAGAAYDRVWERWLATQPKGAVYAGRDHRDVLAIPGAGGAYSPVGHGLSLVSSLVFTAAGPAAHTVPDEDDEGGRRWVLGPPWCAARDALLSAAMGLGAPECTADDTAALTVGWRALRTRT
jgi:hypothetical protein